MILLMGLPGSGKGTQGKMLSDEHGFHLFSTGDLLRMYVTGERRQRMLAGELLDDQEVIDMLDRALRGVEDDNNCILDGFPRTVLQSKWLMQQVAAGRFKLDKIVYLKASKEAVKQRLKSRGRLDDKDDIIEERFREYEKLTQPVLEWLQANGVPVAEIDAERPTGDINRDIVKQLKLA